jgi:hypothetical protein
MARLNPNHPVSIWAQENYHKLIVALMIKFGYTEIDITVEDVKALGDFAGGANIVVHVHNETISLKIVTDKEAQEMADGAGGKVV